MHLFKQAWMQHASSHQLNSQRVQCINLMHIWSCNVTQSHIATYTCAFPISASNCEFFPQKYNYIFTCMYVVTNMTSLQKVKKKIALKRKESRNLSHQYNDEFATVYFVQFGKCKHMCRYCAIMHGCYKKFGPWALFALSATNVICGPVIQQM